MSRKSLNSILVLGVALLFTACAQQAQQEQAPPAETETPAETAEPAMGAPMELTPEKVMELAGMAAQIDANPAMVADLLTQHGMTQTQWDEAMTKIAADTTMSAAFAQAKAAAAAAVPTEAAPAAGGH